MVLRMPRQYETREKTVVELHRSIPNPARRQNDAAAKKHHYSPVMFKNCQFNLYNL